MTKSATGKKHRDAGKALSMDPDMRPLREMLDLIEAKDSIWMKVWSDYIDGEQVAIIGIMRDGVDECCFAQWPVFRGWGWGEGKQTLVHKNTITEMKAIMEAPVPAPRLRTPAEIDSLIERERFILSDKWEILSFPPERKARYDIARVERSIAACELEIARLLKLREERASGA